MGVRRSFEIRSGEKTLAYGDDQGIHYAEGESAETVVRALHEWGTRYIELAETSPRFIESSVRIENVYGIFFQTKG